MHLLGELCVYHRRVSGDSYPTVFRKLIRYKQRIYCIRVAVWTEVYRTIDLFAFAIRLTIIIETVGPVV